MTENPYNPAFGVVPKYYMTNSDISDKFIEGLKHTNDNWRETIITGIRGSGKTTIISDVIQKTMKRDDIVVVSVNAGTSEMLMEIISGLQRKIQRLPKFKSISFKIPSILDVNYEASTKVTSFRYEVEDILSLAQELGITVVIAIDEVQKHSAALRDYVAAYQQWKMQSLPVATLMAGLPSAVNDMLNDAVLTFFKRANQVHISQLNEQDILTNYQQVFGKRMNIVLISKMVEDTFNYAFLFQLIGFYVWFIDKKAYQSTDIDDALALSKKRLFKEIYEPMINDLSKNDRVVLKASRVAFDDKNITISRLKEESAMDDNTISTYRIRLINAEIFKAVGQGLLQYKLPYFKEFLDYYYEK
ncbi:hypothetical protein PUF88_05125 [Lactobacillaceae bacterium L1_55_11]|nr:hypothetical protein [Lactobacillaceae bacterium L1_55_11]